MGRCALDDPDSEIARECGQRTPGLRSGGIAGRGTALVGLARRWANVPDAGRGTYEHRADDASRPGRPDPRTTGSGDRPLAADVERARSPDAALLLPVAPPDPLCRRYRRRGVERGRARTAKAAGVPGRTSAGRERLRCMGSRSAPVRRHHRKDGRAVVDGLCQELDGAAAEPA